LPDALATRLAEALKKAAGQADVIVVSDYGAGTLTGPVRQALDDLRAQGHRICVDSRYDLQHYNGMAAITPNIPEAEGVVGFGLHDQKAVERAGPLLLEQLRCDAALITQGQRGMTLFRRGHPALHTPVVGPAEVTDVTGAGDSVIATLAASLAADLDLVTGMHLANCAAGVVVSKMGAVCAMPEEIVAAAHGCGLGLA
jgi:rfaE bifunctional protein kinase chain/domain